MALQNQERKTNEKNLTKTTQDYQIAASKHVSPTNLSHSPLSTISKRSRKEQKQQWEFENNGNKARKSATSKSVDTHQAHVLVSKLVKIEIRHRVHVHTCERHIKASSKRELTAVKIRMVILARGAKSDHVRVRLDRTGFTMRDIRVLLFKCGAVARKLSRL